MGQSILSLNPHPPPIYRMLNLSEVLFIRPFFSWFVLNGLVIIFFISCYGGGVADDLLLEQTLYFRARTKPALNLIILLGCWVLPKHYHDAVNGELP